MRYTKRNMGNCCGQSLGVTRTPANSYSRLSSYSASSFDNPVEVSYQADSGFKWWHGVILGVIGLGAIIVAKKV